MEKIIRFNEKQKAVILSEMTRNDGKAIVLNGMLKRTNASLPKFIAGLDTTDDLYQAYEIYKSLTTQVKDLKGYDKLIKLNRIHKEYVDTHELEKGIKVYLGKLMDSCQKSNLAGKLYTFQGIIVGVNGKKTTLKLVQEIFLGKQLIQRNELLSVSTDKDFITDDDLAKVYGVSEKSINLFKELCNNITLDRQNFDTFKDFIENYKVEIDNSDRQYREYMQSIVDDYLEY